MQAAPWGSLPSALGKAPVSSARLEAGLGWGPLPLAAPPRSPPRSPPRCPPRPRDAAGLRGLALVVLGAVRRRLRAAGGEEQDALRPRAAGQPRGALPAPGGGGPVRPRQLRLTPAPARWRRTGPRPGCEIPQTQGPGPPASSGSRPSCRIKTGVSHITALLSCVPGGAGRADRAHGLSLGAGVTLQGCSGDHRAQAHTHSTHTAHTPHTYTQGTHPHTHGTHGAHTQDTCCTHTTHIHAGYTHTQHTRCTHTAHRRHTHHTQDTRTTHIRHTHIGHTQHIQVTHTRHTQGTHTYMAPMAHTQTTHTHIHTQH